MNENDILKLTNILNSRPTDELVIIKELANRIIEERKKINMEKVLKISELALATLGV